MDVSPASERRSGAQGSEHCASAATMVVLFCSYFKQYLSPVRAACKATGADRIGSVNTCRLTLLSRENSFSSLMTIPRFTISLAMRFALNR